MWKIEVLGFDIFFIIYSFFIYSFAGWIWETCFCSINRKKFVNRGFLNGPIIPIYGIGGTVVYVTLCKFTYHWPAVFVLGMLMATVLEYITAVLMENAFRAKWWDYSDCKFNFQGRICLKASVLWGVFAVCDVAFLGPFVESIIVKIPRALGEILGIPLVLITLSDLVVTVIYTMQLSESVYRLSKLREEFLSYLLNTKMIEKSGELKEAFYSASITRLSLKKDEMLNMLTSRFRASIAKEESPDQVETRVSGFREELDKKFRTFMSKYKLSSHKNNVIHKRLINAFPDLTFTRGHYFLQEIKERINMRNTKKE